MVSDIFHFYLTKVWHIRCIRNFSSCGDKSIFIKAGRFFINLSMRKIMRKITGTFYGNELTFTTIAAAGAK
jgi:hypothetical protein